MNENPQEKKSAPNVKVNELGFGFILQFNEIPSTEDFCNSVISVFQTSSMSLMQKEPINKALEEAKKLNVKQFVFEGKLDLSGAIEVGIGVLKPNSSIVGSNGRPLVVEGGGVIQMNRQQRRSQKRGK